MLYTFAMYNASLLLLVALLIIPLLQLSLNYTHTSVSKSAHIIFIGALPQMEKYVEQVEKSFL